MTKSPRKNVPDVGIELGAACVPSGLASDRATAPGKTNICVAFWTIIRKFKFKFQAFLQISDDYKKISSVPSNFIIHDKKIQISCVSSNFMRSFIIRIFNWFKFHASLQTPVYKNKMLASKCLSFKPDHVYLTQGVGRLLVSLVPMLEQKKKKKRCERVLLSSWIVRSAVIV